MQEAVALRWPERLQDNLALLLRERAGPVLLLFGLFVIGVVFGSLAVGGLGNQDKQDLVHFVAPSFESLGQGSTLPAAERLRGALTGHLKSLALIWLLGVTVIGSVGILIYSFVRGFITGFVVAFLVAEMGVRGVLFSLAAVLPPNLLAIPGVLLAGACALHFATLVVKNRLAGRRLPFYRELGGYTALIAFTLPALLLAAMIEALLSPALLRLVLSLA